MGSGWASGREAHFILCFSCLIRSRLAGPMYLPCFLCGCFLAKSSLVLSLLRLSWYFLPITLGQVLAAAVSSHCQSDRLSLLSPSNSTPLRLCWPHWNSAALVPYLYSTDNTSKCIWMTPWCAIINIAWGHLPTNSSYGFMSTSGVSLFSGELGKSLQKQHSDDQIFANTHKFQLNQKSPLQVLQRLRVKIDGV